MILEIPDIVKGRRMHDKHNIIKGGWTYDKHNIIMGRWTQDKHITKGGWTQHL
jgi:hypothetical protein